MATNISGPSNGYTPSNIKLNGHNQIVRDFDRAIGIAGLTGFQSRVMQQAREKYWTSATFKAVKSGSDRQPVPFTLSPPELAVPMQCDPSLMRRAIKALVDRRFLFRDPDGLYRINKDPREWLKRDGVSLLFDDSQIAYIVESTRWAKHNVATQQATQSDSTVRKVPVESDSGVRNQDDRSDSQVLASDPGVRPPDSKVRSSDPGVRSQYIGTRPSERLETRETRESVQSAHKPVSSTTNSQPTPLPTLPPTDSIPARMAAILVKRFLDDENRELYEAEFARWVEVGHTEATIRAAVLRGLEKCRDGRGVLAYARTIANDPKNKVAKPAILKLEPIPQHYVLSPEERAMFASWSKPRTQVS